MDKFICPHWTAGQECKRYFKIHWAERLSAALLGIGLALATPMLNCFNAVSTAPPAGQIAWAVIFWGVLLIFTAVGSLVLTLHHETEIWGTFISGLGIPSFIVTLITLPRFV